MKNIFTYLFKNLQIFADGGATGAAGDGSAAVGAGDVAASGQSAAQRLATAQQERENKRNPLRNVQYGRTQAVEQPVEQAQVTEAPAKTVDEEWAELKKGKYSAQYGRDVQAAVQERFKNQADANQTLESLRPMLTALAQKHGVDANDLTALSNKILDDDSLYEEEADKMGMTVEAYKTYSRVKAQADAAQAREEQERQRAAFDNHFRGLVEQGERLKQTFPNFDLETELANPEFMRMTRPGSGISVEAAYYAIHHRELAPQAMAFGIQKAQQQIAQTIQANQRRPDEGALEGQAAIDVRSDPRKLTRADRDEVKRRAERARLSGGNRPSF